MLFSLRPYIYPFEFFCVLSLGHCKWQSLMKLWSRWVYQHKLCTVFCVYSPLPPKISKHMHGAWPFFLGIRRTINTKNKSKTTKTRKNGVLIQIAFSNPFVAKMKEFSYGNHVLQLKEMTHHYIPKVVNQIRTFFKNPCVLVLKEGPINLQR